MELTGSTNDLVNSIAELLRAEVQIEDGIATYTARRNNEEITDIELSVLDEVISKLENFEIYGETTLTTSHTYEVLVREESRFSPLRRNNGHDYLTIDDQENGLIYKLARPSNEYVLFLIDKASAVDNPRALTSPAVERIIERSKEEGHSGIDLVRSCLPRFMTIQIVSTKARQKSEFEKFGTAFLFNFSYNTDSALVQQRNFDELLRTGRITRTRRVSIDELDAPRRHYVTDLIHHYQLAVGSDNPMLEFISYYHIAEHFFEAVFHDDLIENIRTKITSADFSYKRKKDISVLIKHISKSVKHRDESVTFSEQEALRLTILNYCDLEGLKSKIIDYDSNLIDYYKSTTVEFSAGNTVDFDDLDHEKIVKHLAFRIYKTRNAVVHSKDSDKSKYTPFRDDTHLVKEVPLIRFISEQIIFKTSSVA